MNSAQTSKRRMVIYRIILCAFILLAGIGIMAALAALKKPPAKVERKERPIIVETRQMHPQQVPVTITGYGETRPLTIVPMAAEVSGRVVSVHPRLHIGETVHKDETLFQIDDRDYRAAHTEAQASVTALKTTIRRLEAQYKVDQKRLETLRRNQVLANAEFMRLQGLFEKDRVGTRSGVENAEQRYNAAMDAVDQMGQKLEVYPLQIQEARSNLAAATARAQSAAIRLNKCRVKAPFDGRLKSVNLEAGQYVSPGQPLLTLADDSILEIHVPIDSRDARKWLPFQSASDTGAGWFGPVQPVVCKVRWTEAGTEEFWPARLHRVVAFDPQTRTVTVAVRLIRNPEIDSQAATIPLVEGMFCAVEIPGRVMEKVYKLPRWAVSFDGKVYLNVDGRLKTADVTVARIDGTQAYISNGLADGDQVIVTRLVAPLEEALLDAQAEKNSIQ